MRTTNREIVSIVYTDIVGYRRLMEHDQFLAFQMLEKFSRIQKPIIEVYGGKWINNLTDGMISTYTSATDSVLAAAAIHYACSLENDLNLSIGIHLGELEFVEKNVIGNALNLTMQIQASAPPGGIFISEPVQKNLANKKGINTQFIGDKEYAGHFEKIPIYQLEIDGDFVSPLTNVDIISEIPSYKLDKSIAVLPFVDLDNDFDQEYIGDGMSEEIINILSNFREIKVICRSSAFQFKGKKIGIVEIGKRLGVSRILTGNIKKEKGRLTVLARLLNAYTKEVIWNKTYEREMTDIFEVQDEIADVIAKELHTTILKPYKSTQTKFPTSNFEAYEIYLKGQYFWNKRGRWLENGIHKFEEAIELDPNFARAYAGLADAYSALGMYGIIPPTIAMPKGKAAAQKAISLQKDLCTAHTALAFITGFYDKNSEEAEILFSQTVNLFPNEASALYWYSFYLNVVKKDFKLAEELGFKAIILEPHNPVACHIAGLAYLAQRNFDDAMVLARNAINIDSALFLPYFLLGWCELETGDISNSIQTLNFALNLSGRHSWPMGLMIMAKVKNKDFDEAKILLQEIVERSETHYFSTFGAVYGCLALNEYHLALEFLKKGYQNRDILLPLFAHINLMPSNLFTNPELSNYLYQIKILK